MNSFKRVHAFQIELEFGSVGFWGEGKTEVPGGKPLGARERTNNKLNPHMASTSGVEPGPHRWEASALTTAPSLAPQGNDVNLFKENWQMPHPRVKVFWQICLCQVWRSYVFNNVRVRIMLSQFQACPPPSPGHLSGNCHLVGPGGEDLSENLCPGVGYLSILLEDVNVVPFSTLHLKIWTFR